MLIAHVVPGYFAAANSRPAWRPEWGPARRLVLWVVALFITVVPDLDVVYNSLFRNFFNHSTLWTHSLFLYAAIGAASWWTCRSRRWPYLGMILALMTAGGVSHLAMDAFAHSTPLLYPLTLVMIGCPPQRVVEGGLLAYVTDPIFLIEPLLLGAATAHWLLARSLAPGVKRLLLGALIVALLAFGAAFLSLLPLLQKLAR